MTQPNRYDIGYGPLKGPDLSQVSGLNGASALGITVCSYGPGLPSVRGRRPGDQHVDNTDMNALTEYVLAGELGAGYQDTFDRANGTFINSPSAGVEGWVQYPAGIDSAWEISGGAARAQGEYRMLGRPFGPAQNTEVSTRVSGVGAAGATPGVYAYALAAGGQHNGYFFQVRLNQTGTNVFLKRGGTIVNSLATGAAIAVPCVLTLTVDKTTGLITGMVDGVEVIQWTDPNVSDAIGGYCGIGSGAGTSSDVYFDHFLVNEPGKGLQWLPVSGGSNIEWATQAPPPVNYEGSVLGTVEAGAAMGDHTHQSVQFAYEYVEVP